MIKHTRKLLSCLPFLLLLTLAACRQQATAVVVTTPSARTSETTTAITATAVPPHPSQTPPPDPTQTVLTAMRVCSPLLDIPLSDLEGMVSNPFHPPRPGSDDPHQGVDIAVTFPESRVAVSGHAVNALLPGRIAAVNPDRFPYGYAVLVETALADFPPEWITLLEIPDPNPLPPPVISLSCPSGMEPVPENGTRSLYILYAHLEQTAVLTPGDLISCGQRIGTLGMSGNALNPHLHVEARVGPSGWQFDSMAHYDASATLFEMGAYCTWRVGGHFLLVDPLKLFILNP